MYESIKYEKNANGIARDVETKPKSPTRNPTNISVGTKPSTSRFTGRPTREMGT
jgi:hypothetical protein